MEFNIADKLKDWKPTVSKHKNFRDELITRLTDGINNSRERNKKNNKDNKEIINKIKGELLGKSFLGVTITKINETNDGRGFWYHTHRKYSDGSEGKFRYFYHFGDYIYEEFVKDITL